VVIGGLHAVMVTWHDAHSEFDSWTPISDITDEPCVVRTVGLLLPGAKQGHVVVAQSFYLDADGDREIDGVLSIPVGVVQSMVVLAAMSESASGRGSR
jgi:hypothetical protein